MREARRLFGLAATVAALCAAPATAQPLYGYGEDGALYTVDPATAAETKVGTVAVGVGRYVMSVAVSPVDGTLYAQTDDQKIFTIDKATAATQATSYAPSNRFLQMAFTADGTMFTLARTDLTQQNWEFGTLDTTTWQHRVRGNVIGVGFGFAATGDKLYGANTDNTNLQTHDPQTGAVTSSTKLQGDGSTYFASMAFDQAGTLYAALANDQAGTRTLATIDLTTGAITPKGDLGPVSLIAFDKPDPPPPGDGGSGDPPPGGGAATPTPTPAPNPPAAVTPELTAQRVLDALLARLVPTGHRARIRALLRARGFTHRVHVPRTGTLTARWYYAPRGVRAAATRPVLVAKGQTTVGAPGTAALKMRLTARGTKRLHRAKRLRLTLKARFSPAGAAATSATKRFVVRR